MSRPQFAPRYEALLERCQPFVISAASNHPHLELSPLGVEIPPERRYDPTRGGSRRVIDLLHMLDEKSFGGQGMLMPRWVMFDCGEFPGIVAGLGCPARDLDDDLRELYEVDSAADDDTWVPLSMWIAIACAEPGAWFGHNLSSANIMQPKRPLSGLGTLTKVLGMAITRATAQIGATQWASSALGLHVSLGRPALVGAWTPAHTHPATLVYRLSVSEQQLAARLSTDGLRRPTGAGDRAIDCGDEAAMQALQAEIEGGARFTIDRVEALDGHEHRQRVWLEPARP